MAEITFGMWNMQNAFGNELLVGDALRMVETMNADVLYIPETTLLGDETGDVYAHARDEMEEFGYTTHFLSDYYPAKDTRPNQHTMTMWSRIGGDISRQPFGNRFGLEFIAAAGGLRAYGMQLDDIGPAPRLVSAGAFVDHLSDYKGPVLAAVSGELHREDPRAYLMRMANVATRWIPVKHHQEHPSFMQRKLSLLVRGPAMGGGKAIRALEAAGLSCVEDGKYKPTVGGLGSLAIDHLMGRGAKLHDYTIHPRLGTPTDSRPYKPHKALTFRAEY